METAWLIERSTDPAERPHWWSGRGVGGFTPDPNDAIRFRRRIDAQHCAARMMLGATRITEHAWIKP